jgi:hypothetical protein
VALNYPATTPGLCRRSGQNLRRLAVTGLAENSRLALRLFTTGANKGCNRFAAQDAGSMP